MCAVACGGAAVLLSLVCLSVYAPLSSVRGVAVGCALAAVSVCWHFIFLFLLTKDQTSMVYILLCGVIYCGTLRMCALLLLMTDEHHVCVRNADEESCA
jgi:hypothetical protein